jgi:VanZ family protein
LQIRCEKTREAARACLFSATPSGQESGREQSGASRQDFGTSASKGANPTLLLVTGDLRDGSDWIMAKGFHILSATAAWSSLAFIAYATLSPLKERPEISSGLLILFSHFDHYFAYAVMGALFSFAYPRQTFLVCILVLGSAILLELAQMLTADRHARFSDAIRKIIGGAFGIAFAYFTISLRLRQ